MHFGEMNMFALLTVLTVLIASMFVASVFATLKELRNDTVVLKATALRRTEH
jgi:hypothetical protein